MARMWLALLVPLLAGCADQSGGSALNACRMRYYLDPSETQLQTIPDCMQAKSFRLVSDCNTESDIGDWDRAAAETRYLNPQCYRPIGVEPWMATHLSPM